MMGNLMMIGEAAGTGAAPAPGGMNNMALIGWIGIFGVMIFLMFRSQRKQQKQRLQMLDQLKAGDRVLTSGGIYGKILKVKEKSFLVEIADKVEVEISKGGIGGAVGAETENK
ncbi:MAG: preprotein translocase subunit YajC [Victivallales bacterium]|nr:preprotein translocase subunit YajC [Victivallales bacterium]